MPDTILVPVDGSPYAEAVLAPLEPFLRQSGAELLLQRVVPRRGSRAEEGDELDAAEAYLGALAERVADQRGLTARTRVERGDPAERILAVAEETAPRLVAMSTHGLTGFQRLIRGSVAERVLRLARVPLLLLTPAALAAGAVHFERILVPLDGSAQADRILPHVEALARSYGSRVTLLRVEPAVDAPPYPAGPPAVRWDEARLRASLEPQRERLARAGLDVTVQGVVGMISQEVLHAAEQSGLVAMTTHGRSGISRWWFGSVAETVVRHCPCPMLILRAPEEG
ncbi:MAG: universal stress protein [Planctomycetota bacterium]